MNPGVVMRTGEIVIEGGEYPEDSKHISKKTYAKRVTSSNPSPALDMSFSRDLEKSSFETGFNESTISHVINNLNGDSVEALPMSMSSLQIKMMAKDLDPFEGSRKITRENTSKKKY